MEGESSVPKDDGPWPRRLLQDAAAAAGDEGGNDASSAPPRLTQTELLRSTCVVYLSVAALLLLLYFLVRPRFPKVYNLKRSYPSLRSSLAENAHGIASWTWRIFDVDDDALRDRCGMDALTTLRILRLGIKLSSVGTATSAFLIPAYFFAGGGDPNDEDAEYDPVRATSLSNLPPGHPASIATTFAAYVLFGSGMLFLAGDFEWFVSHRRKHLSEKRAENYSVFLAGVPSDLRTEEALRRIFDGFPPDAVADVAVALEIPELEGKAKRREEILPELQHAMNVLSIQGEMPTHKTKRCGGETVDSVSTYGDEVRRLNEEIDVHRARIELLSRVRRGARRASDAAEGDDDADDDDDDDAKEDTDDAKEERALDDAASSGLAGFRDALSAAYGASRDGTPRSAAFASFRTLTSATLARGAFAGTRPWECVAYDAPAPDRVNWKNVGKSNLSKQAGELLALVLTVLLCLFWTVPVSFAASLSNVDALTELLPFLKEPVAKYWWFAELLALLAPLILVVFVSLLPMIVLRIVKLEGHVEVETYCHPSLFRKLAWFTLVQTFLVSTIASTLFSSLEDILKNPSSAVTLLAEALPAQSAYFVQIVVVQNLIPLGLELLRVSPIIQNVLRKVASKALGHDLTPEERSATFLGLRALDDPLEYPFGRELGSKTTLVFAVLFVYGCMAPTTCYFALLVFGLLAVGYRNQFVYVYPPSNDSGGRLWLDFVRLVITCMIAAEVILCAVLVLMGGYIAAGLMVPLIVATILFDVYLKRRHYLTARYLPLGDCAIVDAQNAKGEGVGVADEWLRGAYLQPALKGSRDADVGTSVDEESGAPPDEETRRAEKHKERGNVHMTKRDYYWALRQYDEAIAISPSGPHSHVYYCNRAAARCYLGDYRSAAEDCRRSVALDPKYEKAHTRLGLSLYFQGDYGGAIEAYEKTLDLDPTNQECYNYMVKAKEKLATQSSDEIEVISPRLCGDMDNCCAVVSRNRSFDPSITND